MLTHSELPNGTRRLVVGEVQFRDGRLLDLVRDPADGLSKFVIYDPRTQEHSICVLVYEGYPSEKTSYCNQYYPPAKPADWIRAMALPTEPKFNATLDPLFRGLARAFAPLGAPTANVLAAVTLQTWYPASSATSPRVFLSGPAAHAVNAVLARIWRRGVLLAADEKLGVFPVELMPSLHLQTSSLRLAQRFLRPSLSSNALRWSGAKLLQRDVPRAAAIDEEVRALPGTLNIVANNSIGTLEDDQAEFLQNHLLGWRLVSRANPLPQLETTGDAVLDGLLSAVSGNPDLVALVESSYAELAHPILQEFSGDEHSAVISVLAAAAAEQRPSLRVGEIAEQGTRKLSTSGSYITMSPRRAGSVLGELGFVTVRLGASGRGLVFSQEVREQVSKLAARETPNSEATATDADEDSAQEKPGDIHE